jgi:SAM-dependent methyltransferase
MDRAYAQAYRELYMRHWWWRAREEFLVSVLQRHLPKRPGTRILDIGCGAGLSFDRLDRFGVVEGIEPDTTMRTGQSEIDDRIHWGTLETYRPEYKFSAALYLDVLEHLPDPASTLAATAGLLEDDGIVVATVPAFPLLWTSHDDLNQHVARFTKRTFSEVARLAGYRIDLLRYFFHWLFPAKLVVRFVERWNPLGSMAPAVPRVPRRGINTALHLVTRAEQIATSRLPIPFGSSLLFIGRPR